MGSEERLLLKGRLEEREQRARHLAIAMAGHRKRIRQLNDPYQPIAQYDVTAVRVELDELQAKEQEYQALLHEIARLREDLGLPRYIAPSVG
jgi:ribosomal 50S subunit-associated protein YjgA (DUF615 family)